ncbi:hypothetical protein WJT86_03330 [Microvirga sp. W0021]|uniref:Uncharacterized protein n=1 Tax=Hohaiivirga grylli TaxID=3133970 RepID=A0ABV0BHB6_9HYPH
MADAGVIVDAVATDGIHLARNLTISNNNIPRNEYAGTWSFIANNGLTLRVDGTGATAPVVGISAIGNSRSIKLTNADIDVNANWGVALSAGSYDGQAYIEMNNSRIVVGGNESCPAVLAVAYNEGEAIIQMNGGEVINNNTTQYNSVGLEAKTHGQGAAIVRMTAGTITLSGGIGIISWNTNDDSSISQGEGTGDIIIDTSEGTIINAGARVMYATGDLVDVTSRSNITSNEGIVAGGGQYGVSINVRQTAGFIEAGYIGVYTITFLSGNPVTLSNDARITVSNSGTASSLSYGMAALTSGTGLTTVYNTGTVETRGDYSHATYAKSDGGAVAFNLAGTVTSQGTNSLAVYGIAETSAEVKSSAAISSQNYGIYLTATGTATTADVQLTGGSVTSATRAIRIETPGDISVTNTQGTITATNVGISAEGTSAINISNKGNITVTDASSIGIVANSTTATAEVTVTNTQATISAVDTGILATGTHTVTASNGGEINVSGTLAHGIEATSTSGNANAAVSAGGIIRMTGEDATAVSINALSGTADVKVDGTVETLAKNGRGIRATAAHTDILVDTNGIFTGGWEDGSSAANPSAAIVLASATSRATVTNNGQIGALSDRAIYAPDSFASATNITNNGHITGYVDLGNQQNTFGSWHIRDYSDTNGDGIRERRLSVFQILGHPVIIL